MSEVYYRCRVKDVEPDEDRLTYMKDEEGEIPDKLCIDIPAKDLRKILEGLAVEQSRLTGEMVTLELRID